MNRLALIILLAASTTASAQTVPDKSPHRAGHITRNGVRLHYLDWGGPKNDMVLLLPGLNYNAHVFDDFAPMLNDLFGVIALTPRAHGESDTPSGTTTLDEQADDIVALLDSLHTGRVHIIAHGLAGAVMTHFATKYPERAKKLIYLDATALPGTAPQDLDENGKPFPLPKASRAYETAQAIERAASPEIQQMRTSARAALVADATANPPVYAGLRPDMLMIRANKTMKTNYFWLDKSNASAEQTARAHIELLNSLATEGQSRFDLQAERKKVTTQVIDAQNLIFITEGRKLAFIVRAFMRLFTNNYLPQ
jgi:pimeloyl-ACP methyl ester carboxylesterase